MVPNDKAFDGKQSYEDNGKTIFRWHYVRDIGDYQLQFRFISTNSPYKQGIALFFSEFGGRVWLDGVPLTVPKGKFRHYVFKEGELSNNQFTLSVQCETGYLYFGNASERPELGIFTCGSLGNAFWIENLDSNFYRFHCNDHEYDDDFDDLLFEMKVIR